MHPPHPPPRVNRTESPRTRRHTTNATPAGVHELQGRGVRCWHAAASKCSSSAVQIRSSAPHSAPSPGRRPCGVAACAFSTQTRRRTHRASYAAPPSRLGQRPRHLRQHLRSPPMLRPATPPRRRPPRMPGSGRAAPAVSTMPRPRLRARFAAQPGSHRLQTGGDAPTLQAPGPPKARQHGPRRPQPKGPLRQVHLVLGRTSLPRSRAPGAVAACGAPSRSRPLRARPSPDPRRRRALHLVLLGQRLAMRARQRLLLPTVFWPKRQASSPRRGPSAPRGPS